MKHVLFLLIFILALISTASATVYETINIGINQAYMTAHPELANHVAVNALVADINSVYAPAGKQFYLGSFFVYSDANYNHTTDNITHNAAYYYDNEWGNWIGTTVFLWYYIGQQQLSADIVPQSCWGGFGCEDSRFFGSRRAAAVFYFNREQEDYLLVLRNSGAQYQNGFLVKDAYVSALCHELGHSHGLGNPEGYALSFHDYSNDLPNLGFLDYLAINNNYKDPMTGADVLIYNKLSNVFNTFNKWLIGYNAYHNHYYAPIDVRPTITGMAVKIKVTDANGYTVPNVPVWVYPGVDGSNYIWNMYPGYIEGPYETDINGMVTIVNNFDGAWNAKAVKAVWGANYKGGGVIRAIDLLDAHLRQGLNTYTLTVRMTQQP